MSSTTANIQMDTKDSSVCFRVINLSFFYGETPILKDLSFDLPPGEITGVIGPNGSGKSTLLKSLGGILPAPKNSIFLQGMDIGDYKKKSLAKILCWIPQENPMVFSFLVKEVVMMGRHPYLSALKFEDETDHQIARQAMQWTETEMFSERLFNQISSGEKQRVMVASAIAQEPEVMLLDEPTSALDIKFQLEILNILKRLNKETGLSLVLAIHDLHLASKYCDQLLLLKGGKLVANGTPEEVLKKEILEEVYEVEVKIIPNPDDGSLLVSPVFPNS